MENSRPANNWFNRIPLGFFKFPLFVYSVYVGLGITLAGILHFQIWNESQVQTLFTNFKITEQRPTPVFALILFISTGFISAVLFQLLLRRIRREGGALELIFWGTILSFIFSWIPWFYASSIVNTIFIFLFGMIAVTGYGLSNHILFYTKSENKLPDFWKMFVNATKASVAVLAILLGAIATSVLFPWRDTIAEGYELLRYAILCAYVVIGIISFIIMPLLVRVL